MLEVGASGFMVSYSVSEGDSGFRLEGYRPSLSAVLWHSESNGIVPMDRLPRYSSQLLVRALVCSTVPTFARRWLQANRVIPQCLQRRSRTFRAQCNQEKERNCTTAAFRLPTYPVHPVYPCPFPYLLVVEYEPDSSGSIGVVLDRQSLWTVRSEAEPLSSM